MPRLMELPPTLMPASADFDEERDPARAREARPPEVLVLMGVSGSGKTTVGRALAEELGWRFDDADAFHPPANIAKMSQGIPLEDADRAPWLEAIRQHIATCLQRGERAVVTCSALRQTYRETIHVDPFRVQFVHLKGDYELIRDRIRQRKGHFMKEDLLRSQYATLEPPADAIAVDVGSEPEQIVAAIRRAAKL